jgi:HlyD family secretion protein
MASQPNGGFTRRHRGWLILLAILVGVVLLAAMSRRNSGVLVRSATVARGNIRAVISTNGKIEPQQNFEAHAPANVVIKRVLVHEGDHVKAGQLLLQLDDAQARAMAARALAQLRGAEAGTEALKTGGTREEVLTTESDLVKARTERDAAQRNLNALRRLQQKGAASLGEVHEAENQLRRADAQQNLLEQKLKARYSPPEVEQVQAQHSEARATYAAAQDVLRNSNVRTPLDGMVYSLPVRNGVFVNTGDLLVQVADLSAVQVRAFVDEPDVGRLSPGEPVEVTWDAVPGRIWKGTVTRVPVELKMRGTRNVGEVIISLPNRDLKLLPNVNVNVTIITAEHRDVLTLPREAVHQDGSKPYVFEIVGGKLRRRTVNVVISNLTQAEVTGLGQDAQVALGAINGQPLGNRLAVRVQ